MPVEAHVAILVEADGGSPPGLLADIVRLVTELFTPSNQGLGKWLRDRSGDDLARAEMIRSHVLAAIAEFEPASAGDKVRAPNAIQERTLLLAIVDRLFKLRDLGVEVDLTVVGAALIESLKREL
jgi:hypothetical protein